MRRTGSLDKLETTLVLHGTLDQVVLRIMPLPILEIFQTLAEIGRTLSKLLHRLGIGNLHLEWALGPVVGLDRSSSGMPTMSEIIGTGIDLTRTRLAVILD